MQEGKSKEARWLSKVFLPDPVDNDEIHPIKTLTMEIPDDAELVGSKI
jgi:hypothetical protein